MGSIAVRGCFVCTNRMAHNPENWINRIDRNCYRHGREKELGMDEIAHGNGGVSSAGRKFDVLRVQQLPSVPINSRLPPVRRCRNCFCLDDGYSKGQEARSRCLAPHTGVCRHLCDISWWQWPWWLCQ